MSKAKKGVEVKKSIAQEDDSSKIYLEDLETTSKPVKPPKPPKPVKEKPVQTSVLLSQEMAKRMYNYIYHKRTKGEIFYKQTDLIKEALDHFIGLKNL